MVNRQAEIRCKVV